MTPMADEPSTPGPFPTSIQEFMGQFFAAQPKPPGSPVMPGALSAAQLKSITDSIAAQRRSIKTLQAQLSAFDEQLAALENFLGPLAEWSRSWAEVEQRFLNLGWKPEAGG
jgi:hypothetical protein